MVKMKIRTGFVSNSSSSSFVIRKSYLTVEQIEKIKNHLEVAEKNNNCYRWTIIDNPDLIHGYTVMDNFDMQEFLELIGVDMEHVIWNM